MSVSVPAVLAGLSMLLVFVLLLGQVIGWFCFRGSVELNAPSARRRSRRGWLGSLAPG